MEVLERPRARSGTAETNDAPRVVLLGAGHAHLHVARHADRFARRGARLVLVDPGRFWYSGLATGMLGGRSEPAEVWLDPRPLAERGGGTFVRDRAVHVDLDERRIRCASGRTLGFDLLSFNVGSEVDPSPGVGGSMSVARPVKPIRNLWRLRHELEERWRERPSAAAVRISVIGGGASGCEIAANLDGLARRRRGRIRVTVIERSERILPDAPAEASSRLARELRSRGIAIRTNHAIDRIEPGAAILHDGRPLDHDRCVLATGLRPVALVRDLPLPVGPDGGLEVDATLRSPEDPRVHGAGDCVHLTGHDLPRLGVYGVREAPVLLANLLAALEGGRPERYAPQKEALRILALGDGRGLAIRGRWWWLGRSSLWLKERIDRRWLARYRVREAA